MNTVSLYHIKNDTPRTQLTDVDKGKILAFSGILNATQIAKKVGWDPTTIRRFIKKYKKTGSIKNLSRAGRPPVLNSQEKRILIQEATKERRLPLREIISKLELKCSLSTAKNILHSSGLRSYIASPKPFISEKHASTRVEWCKKNKNMTVRDWANIIFSDESSVEIGKQSRQVRVWRHKGERFEEDCIVPIFKSGRRSVMVWGCFAGGLKGPLIFCDENKEKGEKISANVYVRILDKNLCSFLHAIMELRGKNRSFNRITRRSTPRKLRTNG